MALYIDNMYGSTFDLLAVQTCISSRYLQKSYENWKPWHNQISKQSLRGTWQDDNNCHSSACCLVHTEVAARHVKYCETPCKRNAFGKILWKSDCETSACHLPAASCSADRATVQWIAACPLWRQSTSASALSATITPGLVMRTKRLITIYPSVCMIYQNEWPKKVPKHWHMYVSKWVTQILRGLNGNVLGFYFDVVDELQIFYIATKWDIHGFSCHMRAEK